MNNLSRNLAYMQQALPSCSSVTQRLVRGAREQCKPLVRTAPRAASRCRVAIAAAAEYRPCSAVSRDGVASVALQQEIHRATSGVA